MEIRAEVDRGTVHIVLELFFVVVAARGEFVPDGDLNIPVVSASCPQTSEVQRLITGQGFLEQCLGKSR